MTRTFINMMRSPSGTSLIEFAIAFPLMLTLFFGTIEVNRYILILQKVDRVAYTVADTVTSTKSRQEGQPAVTDLTLATIGNIFQLVPNMMLPYDMTANGIVLVTSVVQPGNTSLPPEVRWTLAGGGAFSLPTMQSDISGINPGDALTQQTNLPTNFSSDIQTIMDSSGGMRANENLLAVEVFYLYQPMFNKIFFEIGQSVMKRDAFFNPRFGEFTQPLEAS